MFVTRKWLYLEQGHSVAANLRNISYKVIFLHKYTRKGKCYETRCNEMHKQELKTFFKTFYFLTMLEEWAHILLIIM